MAKIQKLQERDTGITIYPQTSSEAVILTDGRTAQQVAEDLDSDKVDKVDGKGLSTNDYTDDDKKVVDAAAIAQQQFAIPNKFLSINGSISEGTGTAITHMLPLNRNAPILLRNVTARYNGVGVHFYDVQGVFISYPSEAVNLTNATVEIPISSFPDNAVFFRVSTETVGSSFANGETNEHREGAMSEVITSTISAEHEQFLLIGYSNITTGIISEDRAYVRSGYIAISHDYDIEYYLNGAGAAAQIAFYDAKKQYISGLHATFGDNILPKEDIPGNAFFVVFSTAAATKAKSYYRNGPSREARESAISEAIVASGQAFQDYVASRWQTPGYYLLANGEYRGGETHVNSGFIPLNTNIDLTYSAVSYGTAFSVGFFDAKKQYISGLQDSSLDDVTINKADFPQGAQYFVVCTLKAYVQKSYYSNGNTAESRENAIAGAIVSAEENLFISLWCKAFGSHGGYNPKATADKRYLGNGVEMSYEEAKAVFMSAQIRLGAIGSISQAKVRTNIPLSTYNRVSDDCYAAFQYTALEVLRLGTNDSIELFPARAQYMFSNCTHLKSIFGIINLSGCTTVAEFAQKASALVDIKIKALSMSISFKDSPLLSLESIVYMVTNATNKTQITITVHPDVYAKLTEDTTNAAAAELSPEELEAWGQVLTDALDKQITFATV